MAADGGTGQGNGFPGLDGISDGITPCEASPPSLPVLCILRPLSALQLPNNNPDILHSFKNVIKKR